MKPTGIKLVCERADGEITTWRDTFDKPVEDIIRNVRHNKHWMGGKFLEIYIEFDNENEYYRVNLDIKNAPFNQLLGS